MADWFMKCGNSAQSGFVKSKLSPPFQLLWKTKISNIEDVSVCAGKFAVRSSTGWGEEDIQVLDATDGSTAWDITRRSKRAKASYIVGFAGIASNLGGALQLFDWPTGEGIWISHLPKAVSDAGPHLITEKHVFLGDLVFDVSSGELLYEKEDIESRREVGNRDGLLAYTGDTLAYFRGCGPKVTWQASVPPRTVKQFYISGKLLFVTLEEEFPDKKLAAWDIRDGKQRWKIDFCSDHDLATDGEFIAGLILGTREVSNSRCRCCAFDSKAGKLLWTSDWEVDTAPHSKFVALSPILSDKYVWLAYKDISLGQPSSRLLALDRKTGGTVWEYKFDGHPISLAISDDYLVLATKTAVHCFTNEESSDKRVKRQNSSVKKKATPASKSKPSKKNPKGAEGANKKTRASGKKTTKKKAEKKTRKKV